MRNLLLVFLVSLLLAAGCAQKMPANTGGDVGMIAIPMESAPHAFIRFVYYYEISSSTDRAVSIKLQPIAGRHFAFSAPMPTGKYVLDTVTIYATPHFNTITPANKEVMPLKPPVEVTIEKAKVLFPSNVLEVRILHIGAERYQQVAEWKALDGGEMDKYMKILSETPNIDGWQPLSVKLMSKWYLPPGDISRLIWD